MFTATYKDQTFEVTPVRDTWQIRQDGQLIGIALTQDYIDILIKDRVDYPNWTKKAGCRYD